MTDFYKGGDRPDLLPPVAPDPTEHFPQADGPAVRVPRDVLDIYEEDERKDRVDEAALVTRGVSSYPGNQWTGPEATHTDPTASPAAQPDGTEAGPVRSDPTVDNLWSSLADRISTEEQAGQTAGGDEKPTAEQEQQPLTFITAQYDTADAVRDAAASSQNTGADTRQTDDIGPDIPESPDDRKTSPTDEDRERSTNRSSTHDSDSERNLIDGAIASAAIEAASAASPAAKKGTDKQEKPGILDRPVGLVSGLATIAAAAIAAEIKDMLDGEKGEQATTADKPDKANTPKAAADQDQSHTPSPATETPNTATDIPPSKPNEEATSDKSGSQSADTAAAAATEATDAAANKASDTSSTGAGSERSSSDTSHNDQDTDHTPDSDTTAEPKDNHSMPEQGDKLTRLERKLAAEMLREAFDDDKREKDERKDNAENATPAVDKAPQQQKPAADGANTHTEQAADAESDLHRSTATSQYRAGQEVDGEPETVEVSADDFVGGAADSDMRPAGETTANADPIDVEVIDHTPAAHTTGETVAFGENVVEGVVVTSTGDHAEPHGDAPVGAPSTDAPANLDGAVADSGESAGTPGGSEGNSEEDAGQTGGGQVHDDGSGVRLVGMGAKTGPPPNDGARAPGTPETPPPAPDTHTDQPDAPQAAPRDPHVVRDGITRPHAPTAPPRFRAAVPTHAQRRPISRSVEARLAARAARARIRPGTIPSRSRDVIGGLGGLVAGVASGPAKVLKTKVGEIEKVRGKNPFAYRAVVRLPNGTTRAVTVNAIGRRMAYIRFKFKPTNNEMVG